MTVNVRCAILSPLVLACLSFAQTTRPASSAEGVFDQWMFAAQQADAPTLRKLTFVVEGDSHPEAGAAMLDQIIANLNNPRLRQRLMMPRVETIEAGDCAVVIGKLDDDNRGPKPESTFLIRVDGQWKLLLVASGFERLTNLTKPQQEALTKLEAQANEREQVLARTPAFKPPADLAKRRDLQIKLNDAARKGDLDGVKALVAQGARLGAVNVMHEAPLDAALDGGQLQVASYLIEQGQVPSNKHLLGAIKAKRKEVIRFLLDQKLDPNAMDTFGANKRTTPVMAAIEEGDLETIQLLLDRGATLEAPPGAKWPTLFSAAGRSDWEIFEFVAKRTKDLKATDASGMSALHAACYPYKEKKDAAKIVHYLLDAGLDPLAKVDPARFEPSIRTPLALAAMSGMDDVVALLLERAKYDNEELYRALFQSVASGRAETVKRLLAAGAEVKTLKHSYLLCKAIAMRDVDTVRLLLDAGHPLEGRFYHKDRTALQQAVVHGTSEIVELLLTRGADRRAKDADGNDALALARLRIEKGREYPEGASVRYLPEFKEAPDEAKRILALIEAK